MKQLFTLTATFLGSILMSGAASAAIPGMISKSDLPDWKSRLSELRAHTQGALTRSADAPGEVITEVEGMAMNYTKTFSGFYVALDHIEYFDGQTAPTEFVIGDDGYLYIKDIVSMVPTGSYIRGELTEEGKIEFKFPQTVYFEADEDYGDMWIDVNLFYSSNLDEEIPMPVAENNAIYFTLGDDNSLTMDPLPEGTSVSLSAYPDDMWFGFSETAMTLAPGSDDKDPVVVPEGVEAIPYSYIFDTSFATGVQLPDGKPDYGYHVDIAFDGDDVYLGGMFYDAPDSWVKGRKEGDRIIIPGRQYLGTMSGVIDFKLMYAKWSNEQHTALELMPADTEFTFIYNDAEHTLITADKDILMLMNGQENSLYALQMIEDPTYIYQPDASGAPLAPWGLKYQERNTHGVFDFNLPVLNDKGILLFTDNMYYNVYVNGELLEFYAEENPDFTEDTADIPYNMDKVSIVREIYSSWHEMIVPVVGIETVGVQCVNEWKGEKYYSPLVVLDIATGEIGTGVENINVPSGNADNTYYDLSGRQIANPSEGIYIVRKAYSDGTVKVAKEIVR